MLRWLAGFGMCVALMGGGLVQAGELKPGDAAPGFELPGSDGKTYKLSDYKGKQVVVLAWFPKAFTGGWTAECKSLRECGEDIRQYDVAYFTASCDTPETNKKFAESLDLDYPILSDPEKNVAKSYGVVTAERNLPYRWTFYIGKDGKILHVDRKVNAREHGKEVVAKLEELGVSKRKWEELSPKGRAMLTHVQSEAMFELWSSSQTLGEAISINWCNRAGSGGSTPDRWTR